MVFLLRIKLQRKAKSKPHQGHNNPSACEYFGTKRQDCLYMIVCTYYLETLDAKWDALKAFEHHKLTLKEHGLFYSPCLAWPTCRVCLIYTQGASSCCSGGLSLFTFR
ncbi:hypothetical protein NC652_001835 [Populus alba x Populus x berolinensis]|uniref:Uncharacterized protein n=1 Tax=Populus alba x Populus x berolinensis TaxID=444605 RepID=A0AAD6RN74_9ROSI|nr:hypothetical protein NC652_001835 [Populus alba x Populus x berolinensis]KAJ7011606.1 hypothetical protein NC653_001887 [Populus alba x Populus x berolinensis]